MRREDWPQRLLDRIEAVRDAADAGDTRIRLEPQALGKIDVQIARDGDTLNLRFAAEQPQTRALLENAQPRLAELAAERGLKLGQAQVSGGQAGADQGQRPPRPQPEAPRANHLASDPGVEAREVDRRLA